MAAQRTKSARRIWGPAAMVHLGWKKFLIHHQLERVKATHLKDLEAARYQADV
ncbi:hypothetical protein AM571_PA00168 (plasmid) [Rhizobium etli 8C-3]|uniref:Uncharacterized protein n=1 Tax=Rhizobium etli 8C-3 TaxID=538025 RepID=A0A1L5PAC0_RHIET|nr:hypothetical protein AM571_PA00168 [Rhizobium etli 8C-3]